MNLDIIGDIHGCFMEFQQLTKELQYSWDSGIPVHPDGRKLAFVGDLTDRGPQSLKVIEVVYELSKHHSAYYTPGNHCNKLYRYFSGNKVQVTHGLETTVAEFKALARNEQKRVKTMFRELYEKSPLYLILDEGNLVISHAGIREEDIGKAPSEVKTFVLYGDITGEKHQDGSPVRRDWAKNYHGKATIVYGHTPVPQPRIINQTYNIDTGAVFGGALTALRYPEMALISVPSTMPYVKEKFRKMS